MQVKEVPRRLFNQISDEFGIGEEQDIYCYDTGITYRMRRLRDDASMGFSGAIGFKEFKDDKAALFVFWARVPTGKDSIFEPRPLVEVRVRYAETGVWMYGRGQHKQEEATAWFSSSNLRLASPSMRFLAEILRRATALAADVASISYWEADRNPGLDYSNP